MVGLFRGTVAAACLVAMATLVAPAGLAAVAVVVTNSGQTLEGEVVAETPEQITLRIAGIDTPIKRDQISELTFKQTVQEEYAERRAKIADDDLDSRYALAYWLFENKAYDMALSELRPLERIAPDSERVTRLIALIEGKQQLEAREAAAGTNPQVASTRTKPADTETKENIGDQPALLSNEQISMIRLWELPPDLIEAKPRVRVPSDTLDKLFKDYASKTGVPKGRTEQRIFRGKKGYEQLQLIFDLQARDLYDEVVVLEDPAALIEYRRNINPNYVARYFRQNFGTGQIPGLTLLGNRPNAIDEVYTNFYLLATATQNGLPLINRSAPDQSLLLQWGLPREFATHPAPEIEGWRPFFSGLEDPTYQRYVDWVESLYNQPEYNIRYNPEQNTGAETPQAPAKTN